MKTLNENIIKLEGYGVYVTVIDEKILTSDIDLKTGGPTFDPDRCIEWEELKEPANQDFLNLINIAFNKTYKLSDFTGMMSLKDIKSYQKSITGNLDKARQLRAEIRRMREGKSRV